MIPARRHAVEAAIANARLSGVDLTPETLAILDRYVAGEIDHGEMVRLVGASDLSNNVTALSEASDHDVREYRKHVEWRARGSELMVFRKARENADAIRNMGKEAIAEAHRAGVHAHYRAPELGEGIVRETPDGVRHLERKVDGEWVEVATFPPRPDWVVPKA